MKTTILIIAITAFSAFASAKSTDWIIGKWEGLCLMGVGDEDSSTITKYEFREDKIGYHTLQKFSDSRCQKTQSEVKRKFSFLNRAGTKNSTLIDIKFTDANPGELTRANYEFEKFGPGNRMSQKAIFLLELLNGDWKPSVNFEMKEGQVSAPQLFSFTRRMN